MSIRRATQYLQRGVHSSGRAQSGKTTGEAGQERCFAWGYGCGCVVWSGGSGVLGRLVGHVVSVKRTETPTAPERERGGMNNNVHEGLGVVERELDDVSVTSLVLDVVALPVRVSPTVTEVDGVTEGDGVLLDVTVGVGLKVGDVDGEGVTLAERVGDGVGDGCADAHPPRGGAAYACMLDAIWVTTEGTARHTVPPPLHRDKQERGGVRWGGEGGWQQATRRPACGLASPSLPPSHIHTHK